MNVLLCAASNNFHFIESIASAIAENPAYNIKYCDYGAPTLVDLMWADVVWWEWFDGIVCDLLGNAAVNAKVTAKYIVRLHRYELFTPRTLAKLKQIEATRAYRRIDKLVFVSPGMQAIGKRMFPWMGNSTVLPNLYDGTRFFYAPREKNRKKILFLGRKTYVKNVPFLLTCFDELYRRDAQYRLFLIGDRAEGEVTAYIQNFIQHRRLGHAVFDFGPLSYDKIPEMMAEMDYVVCASTFESFGMGVVEGMATGLIPVVHNFPGAGWIYPARCRFWTADRFCDVVLSNAHDPGQYAQDVMERFSIYHQIHRYTALIDGVCYGNA